MKNEAKIVAVIPARGGSKRIPRKNIKDFCGKPMIAWSIEAARKSDLFDRIIVSTDDVEIMEIAKKYGAEVPFIRSSELSDDFADTTQVIAHSIGWLQNSGVNLAAVCCIYATAPFISHNDIKQAFLLMEKENWQFVFPATTYASPIFRAFKKNSDGGLEMFFPEYIKSRSQDLPEAFHDAGQFYWGRADAWLNTQAFDTSSTILPIPRWRVQDIDTLEDWERAEIMWKLVQTITA